jgi:hypothetical protein
MDVNKVIKEIKQKRYLRNDIISDIIGAVKYIKTCKSCKKKIRGYLNKKIWDIYDNGFCSIECENLGKGNFPT